MWQFMAPQETASERTPLRRMLPKSSARSRSGQARESRSATGTQTAETAADSRGGKFDSGNGH
jgi:hypothetical protein